MAACATQPKIRGAELDALAEQLIQYAADRTDYEPLPPPRIVFVEDVGDVADREISAHYDGPTIAAAGYSTRDGTIYLANSWRPYNDQRAELLHELVHYLQHLQGAPLCRESLEREAYEVQRQWINDNTGYDFPDEWVEQFVPEGCD